MCVSKSNSFGIQRGNIGIDPGQRVLDAGSRTEPSHADVVLPGWIVWLSHDSVEASQLKNFVVVFRRVHVSKGVEVGVSAAEFVNVDSQ